MKDLKAVLVFFCWILYGICSWLLNFFLDLKLRGLKSQVLPRNIFYPLNLRSKILGLALSLKEVVPGISLILAFFTPGIFKPDAFNFKVRGSPKVFKGIYAF